MRRQTASGSSVANRISHICLAFLLFSLSSLLAQAPVANPPVYSVVSPTPPAPAQPADGITLIETPTATPTGAAALAHPIKLPPARKGHAPTLAISYSSDHLHGWLGRGWDLNLPSIDVETRWGVPRFNTTNETETYLLEGNMLAPVAHRGEIRPRSTELIFHPRVENQFQRITRHGDNPKNYWWEIASPDGMIEYYGGTPAGIVPSALLTDRAGNIASWALVQSWDVYGNRIDYHYTVQADNGREESSEAGKNRYPDRITYNGFLDSQGPYEINFIRDRELGEGRRPDVRIDFTSGYKMVTADLLRQVEVRYRGSLVRRYEMAYQTGAFRQQLLTSITEFGSDGSRFAGHNFAYHELPFGEFSAFGPTETWAGGNDNVRAEILNPIPGFTGEISALGGSASTSHQVGSAVTIGPIGPPASKELTVGGTFGSGSSEGKGILTFVDINGDLLPDKVFRRGNDLIWRKNLFGEGSAGFGPVRPVVGVREFSVVSTSETNIGFEANITPFFAGYENTTSRTSTTTYFTDFNGDDLVDILHRGRIYFNHLDANGNPTFTLNSGDTPSPIISGAAPDGDLVSVDPAEQQELIDMTPKHDVVRSWEVPFAGTIRITGGVQLVEQPGIDEYNREDGVRVTIETNANFFANAQLYETVIPANDYVPRIPTGVDAIPVRSGQRIYFRVQSVFDGAFDRVNWDPEITYVGEDPAEIDVNGLTVYRYKASEDFLLASCQTVVMPLAGRVDLRSTFSKPTLTDTLHLELILGGLTIRNWAFAPDSVVTDIELNHLDFDFDIRTERFTFAIRGGDTTYLQRDTMLFLGAAAGAVNWFGEVVVSPGDSVWIEVFAPSALNDELLASTFQLTRNGASLPVTIGKHRMRTADEMVFGPQYRGWGQFVYRGAGALGNAPIQEALLQLPNPDVDEEDIEDIEIDPDDPDFSEFEGLTDDPTQEQFIVMVAEPKAGAWRGYDDLTLVGQDFQSSSRLGEDDVILTPDLGTGGGAPPLTSISRMNALAAGAGFGPASLASSAAWNTTTNLMEVMDLNGDRYPDLVTPQRAQYTTVYGGLSNQSTLHGFGNHEAKSQAIGGTAGGRFVDSSPTNSGDTSGKGSRKRHRRAKTTTKNQGAKAQSANESAEAGGSISLNFSRDEDYTVHSWLDVNGDGLTDKVWDNGDVAFNHGYRFGPRENWGFADIRKGISIDYGGGGGINISNNSFAAGFAITRTDNYSTAALQDVNGDGLADALVYNPETRILRAVLNTGTGFANYIDWARLSEPLDRGDATAESLNFAFTVCIPIFFIRICVNPSGSVGRGASRVLSQFNDIDGDGLLDEISSTTDNQLQVRRSTLGKVNLLRSVSRPLGATMTLDYAAAANENGMPFPKWLLTEVTLNDGVDEDGPRLRRTRMRYQDPVHERHEREFYGFGKTMEEELDTENGDAVYRNYVTEYSNDNFYNRNLPVKEYTLDAEGNRYRETEYTYELRNPDTQTPLSPNLVSSDQGRAFPALLQRTERYYEGGPTAELEQLTTFIYDSIGQVLLKTDFGDGTPEDELRTEYEYYPSPPGVYFTDRVKMLKLYAGGELRRHSQMTVDERGNVLQLQKYLDENTAAVFDYTYDEFGNVLTAARPPNAAGERMQYTYEIDTVEQMYPISTTDSYGYTSTASYEFRYGHQLSSTDINGHTQTLTLDEHGRIAEIKLPKDSAYSYRYTYFPNANPPYARTDHYDPENDTDVPTAVFLDGLGRVIQERHLAEVDGALRMVTTGTMTYDAFDRAVTETYPGLSNLAPFNLSFVPTQSWTAAPKSRSTFDVLDRPTSITMPDNSIKTMAYGFATDPTGIRRFQEKMTDALGFVETTLTDERGRQEVYLREADTLTIQTIFNYNALGELLSVTDNGGFQTIHEYDWLGRKFATTHADGGRVEKVFDLTDNIIRKLTPNLREIMGEDGAIAYSYDHERLTGIVYPVNFQNKVEISYGGPEARFNQTRRELQRTTNGETDRLNSYDQRLQPTETHPHRIKNLGGRAYNYDANGNLIGYQGEAGSYRYQQSRWDEENRMMEFSDNGTISRYTYAADGGRAIQSEGKMKGVFTDGTPTGFVSHSGDYVAYVSPYFTFTNSTFTKHYFVGDQRILTKEGTGEFNNTYWPYGGLTAGDLNYTERMNDLTNTVWNYYVGLGLPPGPPTLPGYYGQPGVTGNPLPTSTGGAFGTDPGLATSGPNGAPTSDGPPGTPTWYVSPPERDSIGVGYGYEGYGVFPEVVTSYYHTDQLGNVTWITDGRGRAGAYRAYLPNGELFIEQTKTAPPLNYTFNGKEKDEASGLHYFGARYLEAETGSWLSIDPLADAYPGHNPYAFGLHNPLRFIDPDGMEAYDLYTTRLGAAIDFARIYNERSIQKNWEFGTKIYKTKLNGRTAYYYDRPRTDRQSSSVNLPTSLSFDKVVADIHTHSRMEHGADGYNEHSPSDRRGNRRDKRPGYVAVPNGELRIFVPKTRQENTVATGLPYDKAFYLKGDPTKEIGKNWQLKTSAMVAGLGTTEHTAVQEWRNKRGFKPFKRAIGERSTKRRKKGGNKAAVRKVWSQ